MNQRDLDHDFAEFKIKGWCNYLSTTPKLSDSEEQAFLSFFMGARVGWGSSVSVAGGLNLARCHRLGLVGLILLRTSALGHAVLRVNFPEGTERWKLSMLLEIWAQRIRLLFLPTFRWPRCHMVTSNFNGWENVPYSTPCGQVRCHSTPVILAQGELKECGHWSNLLSWKEGPVFSLYSNFANSKWWCWCKLERNV